MKGCLTFRSAQGCCCLQNCDDLNQRPDAAEKTGFVCVPFSAEFTPVLAQF